MHVNDGVFTDWAISVDFRVSFQVYAHTLLVLGWTQFSLLHCLSLL